MVLFRLPGKVLLVNVLLANTIMCTTVATANDESDEGASTCEATAAENWDTIKPEGAKEGQEGNGDCPPHLEEATECSFAPKDSYFCHPLFCDDGVLATEGCVGVSSCRSTISLLLSTLQSACLRDLATFTDFLCLHTTKCHHVHHSDGYLGIGHETEQHYLSVLV
jgi:hypothetical protein